MNMYKFKIVLIGDSGVGKTSIVCRFIYQRYNSETYPTIGAAFFIKTVNINNTNVTLKIWDSAGQERYRAITSIYFRDSLGCLCVFDVTNRHSFENLPDWLYDYRNNNNITNNIIIIVANKVDQPETKWKVTREEIAAFAEAEKCSLLYTNCVTGDNVDAAFEKLIAEIIKLNPSDRDDVIIRFPARIADSKCSCSS